MFADFNNLYQLCRVGIQINHIPRLFGSLSTAVHRDGDIRLDEINDLGLTRGFTPDKVAQLDRVLSIADDVPVHTQPLREETEHAVAVGN